MLFATPAVTFSTKYILVAGNLIMADGPTRRLKHTVGYVAALVPCSASGVEKMEQEICIV